MKKMRFPPGVYNPGSEAICKTERVYIIELLGVVGCSFA